MLGLTLRGPEGRPRRAGGVLILTILICASSVGAPPSAQSPVQIVDFGEFGEGTVIRDQYLARGLRLKGDPPDGPFIDDAGGFGFLLDTPPGLLSLNPLAAGSWPSQVHASVGTYILEFVDPDEPALPATTSQVEAVVVLADSGSTILTAVDESGNVVDSDTLVLSDFSFEAHHLRVGGPGIRAVMLTTPIEPPTLGALLDTLVFETPADVSGRSIEIDVVPGSKLNVIRLSGNSTVKVAILSTPGFRPALLDPAAVRFQHAPAFNYSIPDLNGDRVEDLVLSFKAGDLVGLSPSSTQATLTAVDHDGTLLIGVDDVIVRSRFAGADTASGGSNAARSRPIARP